MTDPARHPENYCHRCGGKNCAWSAPSPLWNEVMRGGDINGPWIYDEIVCPVCFAELAEQSGVASNWVFSAKSVHVPLSTVTDSGRVWDEESMLWVDAPADLQEEGAAGEDRVVLKMRVFTKADGLWHWKCLCCTTVSDGYTYGQVLASATRHIEGFTQGTCVDEPQRLS